MDPVTRMEPAFVSVTVRVTVCPEVMLLELAVIETVGTAAAALAANTESATKRKKTCWKGNCFHRGPALGLVHCQIALWGARWSRLDCARPCAGYG